MILGIEAFTPTLRQTLLTIRGVTPHQVLIEYDTLVGNDPSGFKNSVAIWQSANQVPWNQPPLHTQGVPGTTQAGSMVFDGLEIQRKSYIIGYALGEGVGTICSTATISAGGLVGESDYFFTSISILASGTDSLIVGYRAPTGSRPREFGHWVGLWEGGAGSYTHPPDARVPVAYDESTSSVGVQYPFTINTTYTLAYFTGARQTDMACTLVFNTTEVR